jgi:WXG100 family type VII secretion target
MAEAFRVDPDMLADAVQRMVVFERHAESLVAQVDSVVTQLNAAWSGEGAAAHAEAHRRWTRGEAMMREALARLKGAGATAHANYIRATATNSAMWS